MDEHTNNVEVRPSQLHDYNFHYLSPFTPEDTPECKERVKMMWDHLSQCDEQFDDITRGKHEAFLLKMFEAGNYILLIGEDGYVQIENLIPNASAVVHHVIWNRNRDIKELVAAGRELLDYLFTVHGLQRISTYFPVNNNYARRMCTVLGFKFEGELRKAFPFHGNWLNVSIYGILRNEFIKRGVS